MKKFATEEEQKAFELGITCYSAYIEFCLKDSVYDLQNPEILMFAHAIANFVEKKACYIPNKKGISFEDFCETYSDEVVKR